MGLIMKASGKMECSSDKVSSIIKRMARSTMASGSMELLLDMELKLIRIRKSSLKDSGLTIRSYMAALKILMASTQESG